MNLIQAIKTGRPFRRESWNKQAEDWLVATNKFRVVLRESDFAECKLCIEDLIADDWEIKDSAEYISSICMGLNE